MRIASRTPIWFMWTLFIGEVVFFSSCYTRKKATTQYGRAVATFPEIAADYCARTYPPKDSLIKGDTVTTTDTIYTGGNVSFDTTIVMDTKYITKTIQLPGTKIIERITVHDTIVRVSTAAVDLCAIERRNAIMLATDKTKESDKWRKIAKKRFWIILGMGAVMSLGIFALIKRKIAKTVPK